MIVQPNFISSMATTALLLSIIAFPFSIFVAADEMTCANNGNPAAEATSHSSPVLLDEKRMAVKRLIQATINSGGDATALMNDLSLVLGDTVNENEIRALVNEAKKESMTSNATTPTIMSSADRHVAAILQTQHNFDCLEREFNVRDPKFDIKAATTVLEKCRIIVLRNVFAEDVVKKTLAKYQQFTRDVRTGKIHRHGTTTYGGDYFILKEDAYRLNYMIPRDLASPEILANPNVLGILSSERLLDDDFIVNHSGTLNARPGAPPQAWHADAEYLHGRHSFQQFGLGGQDLPPFAISMFTPLLEMTYEHGPTEFCLGTAHLRGHGMDLTVEDDSLLENGVVAQLHQWDRKLRKKKKWPCPEGFARTPLLGLGDVVLFDYMLTHRGGSNQSEDLRSMLFTVYSRSWYKDWTFDINDDDEQTEFERLTEITRFAVVKRTDE